MQNSTIIWTKTDESPAMATYSLLPIVKAFSKKFDIKIKTSDISLANRVLALFPEKIKNEHKIKNELEILSELTSNPEANIIKLPNISASIPQLKACISELQKKGYDIPSFLDTATTPEEKATRKLYKSVLGSAVNPVIRKGNSDRRAPSSIKSYVKKFPHKVGEWDKNSQSHISTMSNGDFRANEISTTLTDNMTAKIVFKGNKSSSIVLSEGILLKKGDIIDATFMSMKALNIFLENQIQDAKEKDIIFSLHLKATMMKVSDPIIFGHCVKTYYKQAIKKNKTIIQELGVNFNNGISDLYAKIKTLSKDEQERIKSDFNEIYNTRADIAILNSTKGITNLHVPSDVIIDASMASAIKDGGKMWDKDDNHRDTKFTIPDSTYAPLYDETMKDCIANGKLDPTKTGTVQNVGLMARKAEEYGSHNHTFEITNNGEISIVNEDNGKVIHSQIVEKGDIWRMVRVQDTPIKDWVELAVKRAKATKYKTIFWLDDDRAHTRELIKKVNLYLQNYDTSELDIEIMSTREAAKQSIRRMRKGKNTISVTGNILRDYNTDLYPVLEVGTSSKMISIVPLMAGGGLFETGAGGSAPKLLEKLFKQNFLEWDSLGEFLALFASFKKIYVKGNDKAVILAKALDMATREVLNNQKSPKSKPKDIDNRGSHFYLALYWANALANQKEDIDIAEHFTNISKQLNENEETILEELLSVQGESVDFKGYYLIEDNVANKIMRPSQTLNKIINSI